MRLLIALPSRKPGNTSRGNTPAWSQPCYPPHRHILQQMCWDTSSTKCGSRSALLPSGDATRADPCSPCSGRDCVKSLRPSYTGSYPQIHPHRSKIAIARSGDGDGGGWGVPAVRMIRMRTYIYAYVYTYIIYVYMYAHIRIFDSRNTPNPTITMPGSRSTYS